MSKDTVYLMQHGEATVETEDSERRSTERGRAGFDRVARRAARLRLGITFVEYRGQISAEEVVTTRGEGPRRQRVLAGKA